MARISASEKMARDVTRGQGRVELILGGGSVRTTIRCTPWRAASTHVFFDQAPLYAVRWSRKPSENRR